MFARTPAFRTAALFAAVALTAAMLGGIDGLAVSRHADTAYAKAKTHTAPAAKVAVANAVARRG